MPAIECFSEPDLRAFLLGQLPERVAQAVSGHLEACPECEAAAQRLDRQTDPVIRALRRAACPAAAGDGTVFLAGRADPTVAEAEATPELPPRRIAGYEVLEEVGRGGMGVVFKARQAHPDRLVALKMILAGAHAGVERQTRFLSEADAIARLQHPHIVQIYEVGQHEGLPYLSLEYVGGGSLAQKLGGLPQPPRQAAVLVETLARTMHHAHEHGVVHRDLKPANILLTPEGTPKVTDFGLAKQERPELTATGAILGTPSYMAPEQAAGDNPAVGPAADIYALGAILYELLTGRPPFRAATALETLAQVGTQEPVSPRQLQPQLPRDLNTICLKCLHKEPRKRYASAHDLAEELRRFLDGKPIQARAVRAAERFRRWSRRNPAVAGLSAGLVVVLFIGLASVLWKWREADNRADAEAIQRLRAERALWEAHLAEAQAGRRTRTMGQRLRSLEAIGKAMQLPLPARRSLGELRNEAASALALPDVELVKEWDGWPKGTIRLSFDGALEHYARTDLQGNVSIHRVADDEKIAHLPGSGADVDAYLSPDGHFLALYYPGTMQLKVLRISNSHPVPVHEDVKVARWAVAFSPDNKCLLYCHPDSRISIATLANSKVTGWPAKGTNTINARFRPDGRQVMFTTQVDGQETIQVRDVLTGAVHRNLPHPAPFSSLVWHPGGQMIATSGTDRRIRLWNAVTGMQTLDLDGHKHFGVRCVFSPDGDWLLSNDWNYLLRMWDVHSGRQVFATPMSYDMYNFSPDGRLPIHEGNKVKLVRIIPGHEFRTLPRLTAVGGYERTGVALRPDGRLLAVTTEEGTCALVDPASRAELAVIRVSHTIPLAFETSGALLTYGSAGLNRWPVQENPKTGICRFGPPKLLFNAPSYQSHGCSPDGGILAIPNDSRGALLLHRDRPGPHLTLGPQTDVRFCAVSPDGRWVATGSFGDTHSDGAKVWDASNGNLVRILPVGGFCQVGFSPDGKWLMTTSGDFRLWAVATWEEGPSIPGESQFVAGNEFAFSPDGRMLAVMGKAGVIRLVETATGREYVRLEAPEPSRLSPRCFTPDGAQLIARGSETQALHVWDLRLIRRGLAEMDLDWEAPPYPPETAPLAPLRVEVVNGK